jgi:hypothetical protein
MGKMTRYIMICLFFLSINCKTDSSIIGLPHDSFEIRGKIIYLSFEGGFYGIVSDDGKHYDPINLPEDYKKVDISVQVVATIYDGYSSHMWGTLINIYSIKKI